MEAQESHKLQDLFDSGVRNQISILSSMVELQPSKLTTSVRFR